MFREGEMDILCQTMFWAVEGRLAKEKIGIKLTGKPERCNGRTTARVVAFAGVVAHFHAICIEMRQKKDGKDELA